MAWGAVTKAGAIAFAVASASALVRFGPPAFPDGTSVHGEHAAGFGDLVSVTASPVLVVEGGTAEAVVTLSIREGYVTHAEDVRVGAGPQVPILLGEPVFPKGEAVEGEEPGYESLAGEVEVRLPIDAGAAVVGVHTWDLDAEVRVCSAHGCRAMREGHVPILVSVVAREGHDPTRP